MGKKNAMGEVSPQFIPETPTDGSSGRIEASFDRTPTAGGTVKAVITYTVGSRAVAVGGKVRLGSPNTGWSRPEIPESRYWYVDRPAEFLRKNSTIRVFSETCSKSSIWIDKKMIRYDPPGGHWRWWACLRVDDGVLSPGDQLVWTYGDPLGGEDGVRVQAFPEADAAFVALVDPLGDGSFVQAHGSPHIFAVENGPARHVKITLPSIVSPGESAYLRVTALDEGHNAAGSPFTALQIDSEANLLEGGQPRTVGAEEAQVGVRARVHFPTKAQVVRVSAFGDGQTEDQESPLAISSWAESNPCIVREDSIEERLFWGDLHCQSRMHGPGAWSVGTPDECYEYARDVAHLDFAGLTDAEVCARDDWREYQEVVRRHNSPGTFVTIKAFEWCSKVYGHRNVFFRDNQIEDRLPESIFLEGIENFYDYFRGRDVIMIPHHTLVWTDWRYHDPGLEPLVEIYSCWGSSESTKSRLWDKSRKPDGGVLNGLKRGYHLGFVGGTDTHAGTPGKSLANSERFAFHPYKGGLTGVYSGDLTQESIFDAIRNRRTYATTGVRIVMDFSVDGQPMGTVVEGATMRGTHHVRCEVHGTDRVHVVELFCNGAIVDVGRFNDRDVVYETEIPAAPCPAYYFVRVRQSDGNAAWASPIWFEA